MKNATFRMNDFPFNNWHDKLDAERLNIKIVKTFKYVSRIILYSGKEIERISGNHPIIPEKSALKDLEKRFQNLDGFNTDISTKTAVNKFKKSNRLKI
jgi:hypothetical protein